MNENENTNTTNETNENKKEKKGILEQFKGLGFWGYLGVAAVIKGVVEIVKVVGKRNN